MRAIPPELPHTEVPDADFNLAAQASYFEWKRRGIPGAEFFSVKWGNWGPGEKWGVYDQDRHTIWLSRELIGHPEEILRTVGHEIQHASEWSKGWFPSEEAAEGAGERLLQAWSQRTAELEAKAAARGVIERPAPVRPHRTDHPCACLELRADPPTRPSWGNWDIPTPGGNT